MEDQKKQGKELNIDLSEDMAQGVFSNLALINHSPTEFVVDFIQIMPGIPKPKVRSRVILTPQHMKKLLRAMNDNVAKFEQQFGEIEEEQSPNIPLNFGGNQGQA